MYYALAKQEPYLAERVKRAVLLAPCSIFATPPPGSLEIWAAQLDIYEMSGPNWDVDKAKACTVTDKYVCEAMDEFDGLQPTSLKSNVHIGQIAQEKVF